MSAPRPSWARYRIGPDEIRFDAGGQRLADLLRDALPRLRGKGEEITEGTILPRMRIVVSACGLRTRDLVRIHPVFLAIYCGAAALMLWWAAIGVFLGAGFLIILSTSLAGHLLQAVLQMRATWRWAAGMITVEKGMLLPVILVNATPWEEPFAGTELMAPASQEVHVLVTLAHEIGHLVVQACCRHDGPPRWLDEGFADWFSEQATGHSHWRLSSQACLSEPERDAGPGGQAQSDHYFRLLARYYWEVRELAEAGKLAEALRARPRRLSELRPVHTTSLSG